MTWEKQMGKKLNSYFTKEPTGMANEPPTLASHALLNAKDKGQGVSSVAAAGTLVRRPAGGSADSVPALGSHLQFLFPLNVDSTWKMTQQAAPGFMLKINENPHPNENLNVNVHRSVILKAKGWKQPSRPSAGE